MHVLNSVFFFLISKSRKKKVRNWTSNGTAAEAQAINNIQMRKRKDETLKKKQSRLCCVNKIMQVIASRLRLQLKYTAQYFPDQVTIGRLQRLIQIKQKTRMSFAFLSLHIHIYTDKIATLNYNELS